MRVQAVAFRVHWATSSPRHGTSHSRVHTGPGGWLLAERRVPETATDDQQTKETEPQEPQEETTKYWFSVLSASTSLERHCPRDAQRDITKQTEKRKGTFDEEEVMV